MTKQWNWNKDFDSTNLIFFLYKWRFPLIIVTGLSILAAVIFSSSFFITPKYKSTVIMFPVSTNSVSKVLISQTAGMKEDILGFGEDEQAEQMLQILNSNLIRDRVIRKFNLMEHYAIDPGSNYKFTKLYSRYEDNVKFRRTEYMAVKVTVFDSDPQMAADMANEIAALIDSVKNDMQRMRAYKAFQIVETEYNLLQDEVNAIVDSLRNLGAIGVNDYERQSEVLNEQLAIAIANNNRSAIGALEKKLSVIGKYGGNYMSLKNSLEFKTEQLTLLKAKYQEAKVDYEQKLPQKFVVNTAYKAERKSYPIRWIIVVVSAFSAFFLTLLIVIIVENISRLELKKN
jgi:uncharacterized protein involved in exopolysaccharide biosynthesis